jgi:hypothetical protein
MGRDIAIAHVIDENDDHVRLYLSHGQWRRDEKQADCQGVPDGGASDCSHLRERVSAIQP